jgi:hypothetical protein
MASIVVPHLVSPNPTLILLFKSTIIRILMEGIAAQDNIAQLISLSLSIAILVTTVLIT